MSEFDSIRPYTDDEVPEVLERILGYPELPKALAKLVSPILDGTAVGERVARIVLRQKTRHLATVADCQALIAEYLEHLIQQTTCGVSVSGLDNLTVGQPYVFVSNHRDIVLDSGLLNYFIHKDGHETSRMAVGDNLLANDLAADLMKLNKSFVIQRGVSGTREGYRVATRTSRYIRHSLEEGVSVWIAQKEGRAKDGWDRTDPTVLKMMALAYKGESDPLNAMIEANRIVPISVSYELDPCAVAKARELRALDCDGSYAKSAEEDVQSIVTGLLGQKGRVHLHIGAPVCSAFASPKDLANAIDEAIMRDIEIFPTHVEAARCLGDTVADANWPTLDAVTQAFAVEREACVAEEQPYWLLQYANVIRNREALGFYR